MSDFLKRKILIAGGSGLLGINWAFYKDKKCNIILGYNKKYVSSKNLFTFKVDFSSLNSTKVILNNIKPDLIINTVGLTNVDQCEKFPDISKLANTIVPKNISLVCYDQNIPFVHISTDHLFSGKKALVSECENHNPLNEYARSKSEAEILVRENNPNALIIRTNFFGWGPKYRVSFSDFIISNLRNKNKITLFNDVFFTPIIIENLIGYIYELLEKGANGVFNVVCSDRLSKYEFGIKIAEKFKLDLNLIKPGSICEFENLVLRPRDMSLSNKKLSNFLQKSIGSSSDQINKLFDQEKNKINLDIINLN